MLAMLQERRCEALLDRQWGGKCVRGEVATGGWCHETTTRAARLERRIQVTLRWIGFVVLRGEPVSQRDVALVVATLPRMKGLKGCVRGEAWWGFERD